MANRYSVGNFQLIYNLRGGRWSKIPDHVWRNVLCRFAVAVCDEVSFDCVSSVDNIRSLKVFDEYAPEYVGDGEFQPNSIPADTPDPIQYRQTVAKFEFNEWVAKLILQEPLNRWCCSNEGIHADEILFWSNGKVKLHAIPWEGVACFDDMTIDEIQLLKACDAQLQEHLYSR